MWTISRIGSYLKSAHMCLLMENGLWYWGKMCLIVFLFVLLSNRRCIASRTRAAVFILHSMINKWNQSMSIFPMHTRWFIFIVLVLVYKVVQQLRKYFLKKSIHYNTIHVHFLGADLLPLSLSTHDRGYSTVERKGCEWHCKRPY